MNKTTLPLILLIMLLMLTGCTTTIKNTKDNPVPVEIINVPPKEYAIRAVEVPSAELNCYDDYMNLAKKYGTFTLTTDYEDYNTEGNVKYPKLYFFFTTNIAGDDLSQPWRKCELQVFSGHRIVQGNGIEFSEAVSTLQECTIPTDCIKNAEQDIKNQITREP